MSGVPIRLRLTLAFAIAMAVVLAAIGTAVYLRFEADLDASVDRALRARGGDLVVAVAAGDPGSLAVGRGGLIEADESFAQVLDGDGSVLDGSRGLGDRALLDAGELPDAGQAEGVTVDRVGVFEPDEPVRLLALPVEADGQRRVVVVGASIEDDREALANLRLLLVVGGPLALALASLAGYGVAAGALWPVEAMRRRAAAISGERAHERLPVPPARDELGRLGTTLNAMLDRLEAALTREREFVANASHELRTPLAILRTELELALRPGRSRDELEAALRSAAEESDRLERLAEDLLLLARLDRGQLSLRRERIDLDDLLATVGERFRRRAAALGRTIAVEGEAGVAVEGDQLRLEQALSNLVDNALRHGRGTIRLGVAERPSRVELHVRDQGDGPSDDLGAAAFDRFARGGRSDGAGAGLGLAIVRAIAESHGGEAALARGEEGADAWVALPR